MVDDIFPSVNGFYLRPEPIDLTEFLSREIKVMVISFYYGVEKRQGLIGDDDLEQLVLPLICRMGFNSSGMRVPVKFQKVACFPNNMPHSYHKHDF